MSAAKPLQGPIGSPQNPVYVNDNGELEATDNKDGVDIESVLSDYKHLPYISAESDVNVIGTSSKRYLSMVTLEPHSATSEHEYTIKNDSILYILPYYPDSLPSFTGRISTGHRFFIYNQLWANAHADDTTIDGYVQFFETHSNDPAMFYIEAGSRIRFTRPGSSDSGITEFVYLIPIKKHNTVLTSKFIPDCNITLDPPLYTCMRTPTLDQYIQDTIGEDGTVSIPAFRGRELKPTVTVTDNDGNVLTEGVDYLVAYKNTTLFGYIARVSNQSGSIERWEIQQGTVEVVGIGEWASSKTLKFDKRCYDGISSIVYGTYYSGTKLVSAGGIHVDRSKLPATVVFEGGYYGGESQRLEVGGHAANSYSSSGKKYFRITYADGTSERDYIEL